MRALDCLRRRGGVKGRSSPAGRVRRDTLPSLRSGASDPCVLACDASATIIVRDARVRIRGSHAWTEGEACEASMIPHANNHDSSGGCGIVTVQYVEDGLIRAATIHAF